ncbi:MAG: hypothetical protein ACLUW8_01900 [Subdoligranulum sp.]
MDDQPGVTEGLCHGVNWAQLGFSQVQAVNSVRKPAPLFTLNTGKPDVMLCDIEMPEETGPGAVRARRGMQRRLPPGASF